MCPGEVDRRIPFGQLRRFAWRELQLATDNFSEKNVLGQGGFGKVYKGVLSDSTKVAVKRLTDYESPGGDAAFQREVEMISVAVHRNLLRLIGFCTTPTERLLVYPYMQNLSVAYRLRGTYFFIICLHLGLQFPKAFLVYLNIKLSWDHLFLLLLLVQTQPKFYRSLEICCKMVIQESNCLIAYLAKLLESAYFDFRLLDSYQGSYSLLFQ